MSKKDLYDELGVDRNATQEEIKKAYKEKSKKHHPDKQGGDEVKFKRLNEAYRLLSEPSARERYDRTGDTTETPFEMKYQSFVQQFFLQAIKAVDVKRMDLVEIFNDIIDDRLSAINKEKQNVGGLRKQLENLQEFEERLISKKGEGILGRFIKIQIEGLEHEIEKRNYMLKEEESFVLKIKEDLLNYEYKTEESMDDQVSRWLENGNSFTVKTTL